MDLVGGYDLVYRINQSIKQKITNNSIIMQNLEKSTTKMKITETKVRSVGGDGGAMEEMMEIWPKPDEISLDLVSSHQIR